MTDYIARLNAGTLTWTFMPYEPRPGEVYSAAEFPNYGLRVCTIALHNVVAILDAGGLYIRMSTSDVGCYIARAQLPAGSLEEFHACLVDAMGGGADPSVTVELSSAGIARMI